MKQGWPIIVAFLVFLVCVFCNAVVETGTHFQNIPQSSLESILSVFASSFVVWFSLGAFICLLPLVFVFLSINWLFHHVKIT